MLVLDEGTFSLHMLSCPTKPFSRMKYEGKAEERKDEKKMKNISAIITCDMQGAVHARSNSDEHVHLTFYLRDRYWFDR